MVGWCVCVACFHLYVSLLLLALWYFRFAKFVCIHWHRGDLFRDTFSCDLALPSRLKVDSVHERVFSRARCGRRSRPRFSLQNSSISRWWFVRWSSLWWNLLRLCDCRECLIVLPVAGIVVGCVPNSELACMPQVQKVIDAPATTRW